MAACLILLTCPTLSKADIVGTKDLTEEDRKAWIQEAISMVAFIEENDLIMREDSYKNYETLILNSSSQEKMDRLNQLLIDGIFVGSEDTIARFKPYYLDEIENANSKEHRDSLRVLEIAKKGMSDWSYEDTIKALDEIASDPDVHPFASIRALSIVGYLYGYSGDKDQIVTTITRMEALANNLNLNPYIAKEIIGLKGFLAHLVNDPEEVVKLSAEVLQLTYETQGLIYGATTANNFTHLVISHGDPESIEEIDIINRRIAHMTGDDKSIFRAYVLCLESSVKLVQTPRALDCFNQAEKFEVENSQSDVRFLLFGMIALSRDGQVEKAQKLLTKLQAIPHIESSAYYEPNIEWAMSELYQAEGKFELAYSGLRRHFNKKLDEQNLELGEISRAMRLNSEEKSGLLQQQANSLLLKEALQKRVINRQKLLIIMAGILVGAMLLFLYLQMRNSQKLKLAQREMSEANKRISLEARTDQLTRIGNRRAFYEYCDELVETGRFQQITMAILDLDGFKSINDTYGHEIGDEIIQATAFRLDKALNSAGRVFRLGGDEMALLFLEDDDSDATDFKRLIENGLNGAVKSAARDFNLIWSVGVTKCDNPDIAPLQYLKRADYALYEAKKIKGKSFHIFSQADLKMMRRDHMMPDEVSWNLTNQNIFMFGQIVVDMRDGHYSPLGVEALLRAQTRCGEPIPPELFVKHAVAMGMADELTQLTLTKAIDMFEASNLACALLFNVSREQINTPNFPKNILDILEARNFAKDNFILELSERTLKNDLKGAEKKLKALQKADIRIALDDFGSANTGFSSLFDFGFDLIKTDRHLLSLAMKTPRSQMLLENLIKFGKKMDVYCIIEGTENLADVSFVRSLGGEIMQGFMFGRPEETPRFRENIDLGKSSSAKFTPELTKQTA